VREHLYLGETKFQAAVVHDDVEEFRDVRLDRQRRHPDPAQFLGVDHAVRSGLQQLGNGLLAGRASDDQQIGAHLARAVKVT